MQSLRLCVLGAATDLERCRETLWGIRGGLTSPHPAFLEIATFFLSVSYTCRSAVRRRRHMSSVPLVILTCICTCISQLVWDKSMAWVEGVTTATKSIAPCKQGKLGRARRPTEHHIITNLLLPDGNTSRSDLRSSGSMKWK